METKDRLRILRETYKIGQEEAARIAGVSKPTYVSYEHGRTQPNAEAAIKLADHYGVSLDYIYRGEECHTPSQTGITDDEQRLLTLWGSLSDRSRNVVLLTIAEIIASQNRASAVRESQGTVLAIERRRTDSDNPTNGDNG